MYKQLPEEQLIGILKERLEEFNSFRLSSNNIDKIVAEILTQNETIDSLKDKEAENTTTENTTSYTSTNKKTDIPSNENQISDSSHKTVFDRRISDRMGGGVFKKRVRRTR
ncbi:hypothetical protein [Aquimarina algiphila]|uniref:hypothetical protein n=1 Tax=Aquimarina algiphila TaxID=2047982 RepID=UPI0023302FDE|nr:hypothetical protein [Aquimarina algiphila]